MPNTLTMLRLVLAAAFFASLNLWRYDAADPQPFWANLAIGLFIVAALTDAADGFLARRWQAVSTFGRIMDPVCDKVLVLGAFVYLAGARFAMPAELPGGAGAMAGGVYPWMVVIIIFRELLVTGVRGVAESMGIRFGSNWWGKWKMILQAVVIPVAIFVAANFDPARDENRWAVIPRDILVWATVIVTLLSGAPYVRDFVAVARQRHGGDGDSEHANDSTAGDSV